MKQSLADLKDYLFEEFERLSNDNIRGEELEEEIKRSMAMTKIADTIISSSSMELKAAELAMEYGISKANVERACSSLIGTKDDKTAT